MSQRKGTTPSPENTDTRRNPAPGSAVGEGVGAATECLDARLTELIAIGASVAGHCQPCLTYHTTKAKELGLTQSQIREAITIGQMVEEGASAAMWEFAKGVLGGPRPSAAGCCAGTVAKGGKKCCG